MNYIIIPTLNDSESLKILLEQWAEDEFIYKKKLEFILIDDSCGTDSLLPVLSNDYPISLIINEKRLGHQKSIIKGLERITSIDLDGFVLTMDADGEDRVEDGKKMIHLFENSKKTIFLAQRLSRKRGTLYQLCYGTFLLLQSILLKRKIRTGNFALFSQSYLQAVKQISYKTGCYSTSFYQLDSPLAFYDCHKGARLFGKSRVGLSGALKHAFIMLRSLKQK